MLAQRAARWGPWQHGSDGTRHARRGRSRCRQKASFFSLCAYLSSLLLRVFLGHGMVSEQAAWCVTSTLTLLFPAGLGTQGSHVNLDERWAEAGPCKPTTATCSCAQRLT